MHQLPLRTRRAERPGRGRAVRAGKVRVDMLRFVRRRPRDHRPGRRPPMGQAGALLHGSRAQGGGEEGAGFRAGAVLRGVERIRRHCPDGFEEAHRFRQPAGDGPIEER